MPLTKSVGRIRKFMIVFAIAAGGLLSFALLQAAGGPPADWPMFGQNASNTAANASTGNSMSAKNVSSLKVKWTFTTGGDVSARAAVVNGVVYFPDWGGNLWAVDANNGHLIWGH